jgi:hypothetical protein
MLGRFVRVSALVIGISLSVGSTVAFACSATAPESDLSGLFGIAGFGTFIFLSGVAIALRRSGPAGDQPASVDDSTTTLSARPSA